MKIQYLGTAAAEGWPAVFCECDACKKARQRKGKSIRTRSQAVIDDTILIDLPPDTYYHVLNYDLALSAFTDIFITHSHQDHFYPQELLLRGEPYAHLNQPEKLTIYGNDKVKSLFNLAIQRNDSPDLPGNLIFQELEPFVPMVLQGGHRVTPLLARHMKDEQCLIYLVEKNGKGLLYANDTGIFPDETWDHLKGHTINCVSFDCTNQMGSDGNYHMGIYDNLEVRRRLEELHCVNEHTKYVVTHFSHNGGLLHEEMVLASQSYGMLTAYDGYVLEF